MTTLSSSVDYLKSGSMTVSATTGRLIALLDDVPHKVFYHVRDAFGSMFGSHRREWLARTEVNFHRGGMKAAPFGSRGGDKGGSFNTDKKFWYTIDPKHKSVPRSQTPRLEDIEGRAYTYSEAALGLETGVDFAPTSGRFLTIPIGYGLNKRGTPKAGFSSPTALAKSPHLVNKETSVRKKPGKTPVMYLKKKLRRKTKYLPIFLLVRSAIRAPKLKFMATWEALESDRARRLKRALDRTVDELEKKKR
jgi:hypothetical protein